MTEEDQKRIKAASRAMLVAKPAPRARRGGRIKMRPRYPFASYGLGGNASDRGKLEALLESKGVPTEVNSEGDPIIVSDAHSERVGRALGFPKRNTYGFKR